MKFPRLKSYLHSITSGKKSKPGLINTIILGLAFCVLFSAYSPTQSFLTNLKPDVGYYSLAILYVSFALSNFFAPAVEKKLGTKPTLILGAVIYTLFIASTISDNNALVMAAAVIMGPGSSLLWTAQGAFLTQCAGTEDMGLYSGIFFAIYMINTGLGNLIGAFIINMGKSDSFLFFVFFIISIFGVAGLFPLKSMQAKLRNKRSLHELGDMHQMDPESGDHEIHGEQEDHIHELPVPSIDETIIVAPTVEKGGVSSSENSSQSDDHHESELLSETPIIPDHDDDESDGDHHDVGEISTSAAPSGRIVKKKSEPNVMEGGKEENVLMATLNVLKTRKMVLCCGAFFFIGYCGAYVGGKFPGGLPKTIVGYVMSVLGVADMIGSILSGHIEKKYGRPAVLIFVLVIQAASALLNLSIYVIPQMEEYKVTVWYICSGLYGFGDPSTAIYAIIGSEFRDSPSGAFAAFRFIQAIASAFGFFFGAFIPDTHFLLSMLFILLVGHLGLYVLVSKKEPEKRALAVLKEFAHNIEVHSHEQSSAPTTPTAAAAGGENAMTPVAAV